MQATAGQNRQPRRLGQSRRVTLPFKPDTSRLIFAPGHIAAFATGAQHHNRIGALRQVVPETLAFGFEIASRDTVCEGALLEHETIEAQLRCEDCATQWALAVLAFRCPTCNGRGAVISGEELTIDWIEVDDPCTV